LGTDNPIYSIVDHCLVFDFLASSGRTEENRISNLPDFPIACKSGPASGINWSGNAVTFSLRRDCRHAAFLRAGHGSSRF
jgi:hypothetical protein